MARLAVPAAAEMVQLEELVRTLRARCPWDMSQTHGSLGRHLLEEAYEALDAIEALSAAEPDVPPEAVAHLEEELGDVLFQVYFHAVLASEEGRFTLADVARTVHDKLVARHPHVFGDAVAETPQAVADRWEVLKKAEKGRYQRHRRHPRRPARSGSGGQAPAQGGVAGHGPTRPGGPAPRARVRPDCAWGSHRGRRASRPTGHGRDARPRPPTPPGPSAPALFALADVARLLGVDPESALRARAGAVPHRDRGGRAPLTHGVSLAVSCPVLSPSVLAPGDSAAKCVQRVTLATPITGASRS